MAFRLNSRDYEIMGSVAEYRILTVRHITTLHQRNTRAVRRRLQALRGHGLIRVDTHILGDRRGRPEGLLSLCEAGVEALQESHLLPSDVPTEHATAQGVGSVPHLLLTNDFRIQLVQMERLVPAVTTRFLSPLSPFLTRSADNQPFVHERIQVDQATGRCLEFTPDGVAAITHSEAGKTLLFFLEVDMGTETLVSRRPGGQDVHQKILNYQTLYRSQACRRYQQLVGAQLRGFRLLILANSESRSAAICRLIRDTGSPEFVLVAQHHRMESSGVWAEIWTAGGLTESPPISILGSRMPRPALCRAMRTRQI